MERKRGHAYPAELRARVMELLHHGRTDTDTARTLSVSRMTVWRYKNMAAQQHTAVPVARPSGGARRGQTVVTGDVAATLGRTRAAHPKLAVPQLKQLAVDEKVFDAKNVPSDSTVYRVLRHKLGFRHKRATYYDPVAADAKSSGEAQRKRLQFRRFQRQGPRGPLDPSRLLFMDETNFRLNEQARYAWARDGAAARLPRRKGQTPTFNVIATMGVEHPQQQQPPLLLLHWVIVPPRRDYHPFPLRHQAYEFRRPTAPVFMDVSAREITTTLTFRELRQLMDDHDLRLPPRQQRRTREEEEEEMRRVLVHARTRGRVGLWRTLRGRRGRTFQGGTTKPFRATAADVLEYLRDLLVPYYVRRRLQGLAFECKGDGLVGCPDGGHHFSVAYQPPDDVRTFQLRRALQRAQRGLHIARHHLEVVTGGRRELAQQRLREAAAAAQQAEQVMKRFRPQRSRFVDEVRHGRGYAASLARKTLVWDNASTHVPPPPPRARGRVGVSFYHRFAREQLGMHGVVYLPPRSPTLNPMELVFGHVKRYVRSQCPKQGTYDAKRLVEAIHAGFARITPEIAMHFVQKCGYRFLAGALPPPPPEAKARPPQRYVGLGGLVDKVAEVRPQSVVRQDGAYEVDGIVDARTNHETSQAEFLVRWKGYGRAYDEWIAEEELRHTAAQAIREYQWRTESP